MTSPLNPIAHLSEIGLKVFSGRYLWVMSRGSFHWRPRLPGTRQYTWSLLPLLIMYGSQFDKAVFDRPRGQMSFCSYALISSQIYFPIASYHIACQSVILPHSSLQLFVQLQNIAAEVA